MPAVAAAHRLRSCECVGSIDARIKFYGRGSVGAQCSLHYSSGLDLAFIETADGELATDLRSARKEGMAGNGTDVVGQCAFPSVPNSATHQRS